MYLFMLEINPFQICLGVRNLAVLTSLFALCTDDQQRRFARAKLNVFNLPDLATRVEHHAAYQVAYVIPSWIKLRPLTAGNLQFAADQSLGIGDRIDARKLQNQVALVRPEFFDLQLAPGVVSRESEHPQAHSEPVRNVAVQLDCDFATAPLRFSHASQGNELA